ncbi:hypothetical protein GCM10010987_46010 [Bradyrhizobium guangdongense]|uniref:Uncharacterized protein n=1 Tax=Bradyrhizobium guangdongense TaxID=1325090 RepID=A0AA87WAG2_9BRAD|nr:hypothetical protein GCM10010987_46010 [Bradyrhizobium guangdongense]
MGRLYWPLPVERTAEAIDDAAQQIGTDRNFLHSPGRNHFRTARHAYHVADWREQYSIRQQTDHLRIK